MQPEVVRDTREKVEDDFRYDCTNALLDLVLKGEITLEQVKEDYLHHFPEQRHNSDGS